MKNILFFALLSFFSVSLLGQEAQYTSTEDSDPQATAALEKLRKKYDGYQSLEVDFRLEIAIPEQPVETQKGSLTRQGDKYRMNLASYSAISDGTAIWLILHNNKEVQINDIPEADESNSILSPQAIMSLYENGDYVYLLTNEFAENGTVVQQIEFKPLDPYSEYSKLRMTIDKKGNDLVRVKAFAKDGSRYTFYMDKLMPNKKYEVGHFSFREADYPDYYVEDLRE